MVIKRKTPKFDPLPSERVTKRASDDRRWIRGGGIDWVHVAVTVGTNLAFAATTLASIIQGLDVVERRWKEHQAKRKPQDTQIVQPASSSSKTAVPDTDVIEVLLVMDDGSRHGFKRWVSNPDALRAYIDAFNGPSSKVKPLYVVFRKLDGRVLRVDVTEGGKDNQQLDAILGYLEADPQ